MDEFSYEYHIHGSSQENCKYNQEISGYVTAFLTVTGGVVRRNDFRIANTYYSTITHSSRASLIPLISFACKAYWSHGRARVQASFLP